MRNLLPWGHWAEPAPRGSRAAWLLHVVGAETPLPATGQRGGRLGFCAVGRAQRGHVYGKAGSLAV